MIDFLGDQISSIWISKKKIKSTINFVEMKNNDVDLSDDCQLNVNF